MERLRVASLQYFVRPVASFDQFGGELNLSTILDSRASGTVVPLYDSRNTLAIVADLEEVSL